ncbi:MAG TPA: FAD-dependent oxidoreductase, partial [Gemmatimonadales bacterium]|nr:FAD-dependent oxidoreductase [Gemmatimonadales bacterium]
GGKIVAGRFATAPVTYEAGAAELYDYSSTGRDPLRELIAELGLGVHSMRGSAVVIDDQIVTGMSDVQRVLGDAALAALKQFDATARAAIAPRNFYDADWLDHSGNPLASDSFQTLLDAVPDAEARRYLRVMVHSDVAAEPHQTNALYGLQNYLMNDTEYLGLYTVDGGIERLPRAIAARLAATIRLNDAVVSVEQDEDDTLIVESLHDGEVHSASYDYVVVSLPNDALPAIAWRGDRLEQAMQRHHARYDHPAHYLRVTMLFREAFWRDHVGGSYFMLDAFDGCCVYDESARSELAGPPVLGFLLAGEAALRLGNLADDMIVDEILNALPTLLTPARSHLLETRVHRWLGAVNAMPAGTSAVPMDERHMPEPVDHGNLMVTGDYLFDSTVNGVFDSAEYVADWLADEIHDVHAAASRPAADSR